jgi:ADP-ribose pyrophosphatase YjhB (NUDIX family)/CheY-like chemotaxis protein
MAEGPLPTLTADVAVLAPGERVLLVRRGIPPFLGHWCLPGGHVDTSVDGETALQGAARELQEETGLAVPERDLTFVALLDRPHRDPRGRVVTALYAVCLDHEPSVQGGDDAAEARFFSRAEADAMTLAFDHNDALRAALTWARARHLYDLGYAAAGVAHDLHNALAPLGARLQNALTASSWQREVAAAQAACAQAESILQRLRRALGAEPPRLDVFLLLPVLRAAMVRVSGIEGATLDADGTLRGDPDELQEAVFNLLKNAREAAGERGKVALRTRIDSDALTVEVEDDGPGLQGHRPFLTGRMGGMGLGLQNALWALKQFGAEVRIHSGLLGGALFQIRFPPQAPPRPVAVLVVEDDPATAELLSDLLHQRGHTVHTARDTQSARALAAAQRMDLLITDLDLPDASGADLIRWMGERSPTTACCLMSGWVRAQDAPVGAAWLLCKPFTIEQFDAMLARACA